MSNSLRIAIMGNIGAGKSTLIEKISLHPKALEICKSLQVSEKIITYPEEFIPKSLELFYQDPKKYAFQLQTEFLNARISRFESANEAQGMIIEDRTLFEDFHVFGKAQFQLGRMSQKEFKQYQQHYLKALPQAPHPDLIVYLKADPSTLLERIKLRNRSSELSISINYLSFLNELYNHYIHKNCEYKVLTIEAFHQNDLDKYTLNILDMIAYQLSSLKLKT